MPVPVLCRPLRGLFLLGLCSVLLSRPAAAQTAPGWQSVLAATQGPRQSSIVTAVTTDAAGNVYLAGRFSGPTSLGSFMLTNSGGYWDVFVAKWSPVTQNFVWAQSAGGTASDEVRAIAVQGNSVYVAGSYGSPDAAFGSTVLPAPTNSTDSFVAKLTDAGSSASWAWAEHIGGGSTELALSLAVSGADLYVGGSFASSSTATTATVTFGTLTLTAAAPGSGSDGFVAKYTDAGSSARCVWAQRVGGVGDDAIRTVAVAGAQVYVGGVLNDRVVDFGGPPLTAAGLSGPDGFVAKLTDAGSSASLAWLQRNAGSGFEMVTSLAVQGSSIYAGGEFIGSSQFGGTTLTHSLPPGANYSRAGFVTKLHDAGSSAGFVWALQNTAAFTTLQMLVAQGSTVSVTGTVVGPVQFGSTSISLPTTTTKAYLAQISDDGATGRFAWAQTPSGPGYEETYALAVSSSGQLYMGGAVSSTTAFGPQTVTVNDNLPTAFLAATPGAVLGTSAPARPAGLTLYPNPARSAVYVQLPGTAAAATFTLRDALGRSVRTGRLQPTEGSRVGTVSVRGLPAGPYFLQVQAGPLRSGQRLLVE